MAEQPALLRSAGTPGPGSSSTRAADVVQERRREEQVGAQPRMELAQLAADRRDADRVLEQAARVVVVPVGRGRERAQPPRGSPGRRGTRCDGRAQARVRDLAGEELEEAVELVRVAAHRGREARRVGVRRGLDRAHVELEPVAVALDAAEHAHRVALAEARVEQVDVVPDARLDAAARVDELEREVRRRRPSSAAAACGRPRRRPRRRGPRPARRSRSHAPSLGRNAAARVRAVADVKPFRAAPLRRAHGRRARRRSSRRRTT